MTSHPPVRAHLDWTVPYLRLVRWLRFVLMVLGLALTLLLAAFGPDDLTDEPFVLGMSLFAVATGLTWTAGFTRARPSTLTLIALLDLGVISLFDLIPNAEVVDALIALPAMWLGLTLGRRGVAAAALSVAAMVVLPGVLLAGAPREGWAQAVSITLLAALAAAGMAVSTEVWMRQLRNLEHQGDALQSAMQAKGDFISLVSHELRTPLTSIIGYMDLLDDVDEPLPQEAIPYLAAVSRNSDRLLLLVTDLLAASEVENTAMRLDLAPTDVSALANQSLDDLSQRVGEAGLSLVRDLTPGLVIRADASRLMQVVENLLSNAIKFTPAGGRIFVTLRRHGDGVDLIVRDTGMGIEAASLPYLTTKFFRTRQATEAAIPGVGLGLLITRTVVQAHHGTLTFTSREHEGTSVLVHLPTSPPTSIGTPSGSDAESTVLPRVPAAHLRPSLVTGRATQVSHRRGA